MSFFSIGHNEVNRLLEREREILNQMDDSKSSSGNVCNFKTIMLQKEIKNIRNRLQVLRFLSPSENNEDNSTA